MLFQLSYTDLGAMGAADHLTLLRLFTTASANPHATWVTEYPALFILQGPVDLETVRVSMKAMAHS